MKISFSKAIVYFSQSKNFLYMNIVGFFYWKQKLIMMNKRIWDVYISTVLCPMSEGTGLLQYVLLKCSVDKEN